jgi:hypothetical protein
MNPSQQIICLAALSAAISCLAQAPATRPQFEVASIKPNPNCAGERRGPERLPSPGRIDID